MAGLLDLGGGVKMADPGNFIPPSPPNPLEQATQVMGLQNLSLSIQEKRQKAELAPFEMAKAASEADKARSESVKSYSDTLTRIYGLAQTGDELGATQLYQILTGDSTAVVTLPEDRNALSQGLVTVSQGDTVRMVDPLAEFRIKERIKMQFDIMKDLQTKSTSKAFDDQKWIRDTALKLTEEGSVATPREGILAAQALVAATRIDANRQSVIGQGQPSKKLTELSEEAFTSVARASVARASAQATDPLDISLVKKSAPSNELISQFDKSLAFVSTLSENVLPAFQSLGNLKIGTGLPGGTINNLRSKFSAQPEVVAALDVITTKASFDKVLEIAATTFSDKVVNQIKNLMPQNTDRLDVAYTKIATMLALTTAGVTNKLDVAEAGNVNVRAMRKLIGTRLNSDAIASGPAGSTDEQIKQAMEGTLNALGPDILKDRSLMGAFTRNLPGRYKDAAVEILAGKGEVPTETAQDIFAKDFGLTMR